MHVTCVRVRARTVAHEGVETALTDMTSDKQAFMGLLATGIVGSCVGKHAMMMMTGLCKHGCNDAVHLCAAATMHGHGDHDA